MSLLSSVLAETRRKRLAAQEAIDLMSSSSESEEVSDDNLSDYHPESTESDSENETELHPPEIEEIEGDQGNMNTSVPTIATNQMEQFKESHFSETLEKVACEGIDTVSTVIFEF